MSCNNPIQAYRTAHGITFHESARNDNLGPVQIACGQCIGCRIKRAREWTSRIVHESKLYEENCFLTLTYSDLSIPSDGNLRYPDFQKFMRRLRKAVSPRQVRFYMVGEYGSENFRPHYHACLFNIDFKDLEPASNNNSGAPVYVSRLLNELWTLGFHTVAPLTRETAAYTARYVITKLTGEAAKGEQVDRDGVITARVPEFNRMSLRPGIGADWFARYHGDLYPHDYLVVDGHKEPIPRYYDRLQDRGPIERAVELESVKHQRVLDAKRRSADNTPERLAVKERLAKNRLAELKRNL